MSTKFAVIDKDNQLIEVALRSGGTIRWINDIASMLPNDVEVIPVDNSAQGINTIGDIRDAINDGKI
jgi:hypothetical protein